MAPNRGSRCGHGSSANARQTLDAALGLVDDDSLDGARRPPAAASVRVIDRIAKKQLARGGVVSLLRDGVLGSGVNVAHPPLQRRALVERAATTEREARIGDMSADRCEPCRGLRALREERLVS